ncbi:MAG: hypothetical protein VW806_06200 [Halieaceae bacterium]|jgi:ketosteroid isomerase-like protein
MKLLLMVLVTAVLANPIARAGHHEGDQAAIGVQIFDDGRSVPLVAGAQSNVALWQEYIQAHNDRDFAKIAAMNADDFSAIVPTGERVTGSEGQAEFLKAWIAESNPVWKVMYVVANDGENTEGEMEEWLSTGQMITSTDAEGNQTAEYHSIDVKLASGKVQQVYVAAMRVPSE